MRYTPTPGMLVHSKAGRDAGRAFLIREVLSSEFVTVVDGDLRRIKTPKKKKIKHLKLTPKVDEALQKGFIQGIIINDAQVRASIKALTEKQTARKQSED